MSTFENKSKRELIEEIKSLKNQVRNLEEIEEGRIQKANELRESEEKVRASNYLLEQVLNTNPAVIFVKDKNSKVLMANKTMADFYNLSIEEVIGRNQSDLHHQFGSEHQEIEKWLADDREVIETSQAKHLVESGTDRNKIQHWFQTGKYPVDLDQGQKGVLVISEDITERKGTEKALQESEERFRRLAENAPEIIYRFRISPDPGFDFISPAVTEIAGYTPQEYYDDPNLGFKIIHPDDRVKLDGFYEGIIPEGPYQVRWIRKDGKIIWTEDRATPIFNDKDEFIAIEGIAREITVQKEAEDALREAYDIINKSPAIPFLWKNEEGWPVEYVSENVANLFEYSAEEFMSGKVRYSELIYPEDINRIENEVIKFSSEKDRHRFSHEPYRIVTKSGRIKWVEDKTYIRRDENNNITHYQGIVEDITTRRLAEIDRLESEEKFSKTFNSSPSPMIISEIESGKVVDINKSFEKLIMYSKQEVLGKSVFDLNLWANIEDRGNYIKKMKEDKRVSNLEIKIRTKSEEIRDTLISGEIITIQDKPYLLTSGIDITERKLAEEALRDNENKFRNVLENIQLIGLMLDKDGRLTFANDYLLKLTGWKREEAIGKDWFENFLPDNVRANVKKMFYENINSGSFPQSYKNEIITKEGELKIISWSNSAHVDNNNKTYAVTSIGEDITERMQAEEALRESEWKFREMADLSPIIVYEIDININLTFFNKRASAIFGFSEHDLMSNFNVLDRVIPEDKDRARENMKKIMNGKSASNTEYTLIKKDGSTFPVLIYSNRVMKDNKPVGLRGIIIDMTERKQAEEALRESEEKFRKMFNESPIGIELYKADGMQLTANKASLKMFGIPDESEIYGFNIFDGSSLDVEKKERLRRGESVEYQSAFDFEKVKELQQYKTDRIGTAYFNYIITPLLDIEKQTIQGYLLQVQDITERKKADKKLRDSHNQLRSLAERLQMIREEERATVAREIHDDLGQTLTALKMDIAWMKKNSGMTEKMRVSKLDGILELTDSTIQTVKRIATDLRPGILDDLGLVSAIEWQTKEFQNRSGIECNFEISVDEFAIEDDISIAVFRIFQESLTNIARHSQATKVTVTIMREEDFLLVEISDNGVGISEEQINSSKSLGLIGMNERVSVFRGKLKISRAAEGGTTVRVYIPM